jgi:hypothetical protein
MLLIYVIGPAFVQSDRTYPLWAYNLIRVLGNGAELLVALLIFRREGYRLTPKVLRADQPVLPRQAVEVGGVRRRFCRGHRPGPVGRPA